METVKRIGLGLSYAVTVLLAIILVCNIYTIAARQITGEFQPTIFGWSTAVVISGSMEPEISLDDMIIVKSQKDYDLGDVVSYKSGNSVVTHRIVGEQDGKYILKGDANNIQDADPVIKENIIGKVVCAIPKVGLILSFLRTPLGLTCLVFIGFLMIEIPYLLQKKK